MRILGLSHSVMMVPVCVIEDGEIKFASAQKDLANVKTIRSVEQ